jgi:O-antigen biosynthesis protein
VQITGPLADLTDAYARARVFVAPTRFAAGIPFKVHEAAARGVPIVLTSLLAEQIGWTHECEVLIAETPEDFAAQCQRLHSDKMLWNRLRERALARVAQDCDPQLFRTTVTTTIAEAMACGEMRAAV